MFMLRTKTVKFLLFMVLCAVSAAVFLFLIGQNALNGQHVFQFFADSNTYHQTYSEGVSDSNVSLIGVSNNYLGPILVLELLRGNIYLVMLFNMYLFTHSIICITRLLKLDPLKVGLLLLVSPLTVSSLLSVNKEIFVFPFLAFALNGYMRKSILSEVVALAFSAFVRWQFAGFYLLVLLTSRLRLVCRRDVLLLLLLLAFQFCICSYSHGLSRCWLIENSFMTYDSDGSWLFEWSLNHQNQGLYFFVFPIKAFHLLFGMGLKVDTIISPANIYNDLFFGGHCAISFLVFLSLFKRQIISLRSDLFFVSLVFLAIFCVTPVFAPRYLFFVFVLWVLMLAGAPPKITNRSKVVKYRSIASKSGTSSCVGIH